MIVNQPQAKSPRKTGKTTGAGKVASQSPKTVARLMKKGKLLAIKIVFFFRDALSSNVKDNHDQHRVV